MNNLPALKVTRVSYDNKVYLSVVKNISSIIKVEPYKEIYYIYKEFISDDIFDDIMSGAEYSEVKFYHTRTKQLVDLYRIEVSKPSDSLLELLRNNRDSLCQPSTELWKLIEDNDYYTPFNTFRYKIMTFDIEALTRNNAIFPDYKTSSVISIGYQIIIFDGSTFLESKPEVIVNENQNNLMDDNAVITSFCKILDKEKPDILVGYNSEMFDVPFLIQRALINDKTAYSMYLSSDKKYNEVDFAIRYCRKNRNVKVLSRYIKRYLYDIEDDNYIGLHYDIYKTDVSRDVTLIKLRDRKMKTVAKHYMYKDALILTDEEYINTEKLFKENKQRLIDYQISDVCVTTHLFKTYFLTNVELAISLKVPLSIIINRSNATIPALDRAVELYKAGYIAVGNNIYKYSDIYNAYNGNKYEAAYVAVCKTGFFDKLYKYDFTSMYPNAEITFNIAPDTYSFYSIEYDQAVKAAGDSDEYLDYKDLIKIKEDNDKYRIIGFADRKLGGYIYLKVLKKESLITKKTLENFLARKKLKKQLKDKNITPEMTKVIDARQNSYKIRINAGYGIYGNLKTYVGDLPCAIAIVSYCRYITRYLHQDVFGNCVNEIDTDGIIVNKKFQVEYINEKISDMLYNNLGISKDRCFMTVEEEEFGKGFIYKSKNYIIEDGDEIIVKGSAFRSRTKPPIYYKAVEHLFKYYAKNRVIDSNILTIPYTCDKKDLKMTFIVTRSKEDYTFYNDTIKEIKNMLYNENVKDRIVRCGEKFINLITKDENEYRILFERRYISDEHFERRMEKLSLMKSRLYEIIGNKSIVARSSILAAIFNEYCIINNTVSKSYSMSLYLIEQFEKFYNKPVYAGQNIYFYYTNSDPGYSICEIGEDDINYEKYVSLLMDLLSIFNDTIGSTKIDIPVLW